MSSTRRIGGEINILAMLDGQAGKPRRGEGLRRAAWYGAGTVLTCALLGAVARMVHEQADGSFEGRVATGPAVVPLVIAAETLPNPPLRVAAQGVAHGMGSEVAHRVAHETAKQPHGAAIVDLAPPTDAAPRPRVLEDLAPPDAAQVAATHGPRPVPVPTSASHPAPQPAFRAVSASKPASKPPTTPASRLASKPAAQARPEPAATHPRRTAALAKPKPATAPVDTDVALISAIIQHLKQHGEAEDAGGCGNKPCQLQMTNRPSSRATPP